MNHRVYFDHDSAISSLVTELQRRQHDCLVSAAVGMSRALDSEQLEFATREDRVIVTANQSDDARLHVEWIRAGRSHAGIIVAPQAMDLKLKMRRMRQLLSTTTPDQLRSQLIFLNAWFGPDPENLTPPS